MWMLQLNDMRASKSEHLTPVAIAESRELLVDFASNEKVEHYTTDDHWGKGFRQGGPLEWYNGPNHNSYVNIGTVDDWMNKAARKYNNLIEGLIKV
jgi:hypothetical protein